MMLMIALVSHASAGAYELLRPRDGVDCAALGSGSAVRDELITLAEDDAQPSYVPMRAAACLIEGFATDPVVVEHARRWVTEERWAGLGIVVGNGIDRFLLVDAMTLARAAATAESRAVRRIARSEREEVRAEVKRVDGSGGGL